MRRTFAMALAAALLAAACALVAGVDGEYRPHNSAAGGTSTSTGGMAAGGGGGSGGATSSGGGVGGGSNLVECDGHTVDILRDPDHCGECGNDCSSDEYCSDGECGCFPGHVLIDFQCVDPDVSPWHCGTDGVMCDGATPLCDDGICVSECSPPPGAQCSLCYDNDSDHQHCGGCKNQDKCGSDQICVDGSCVGWSVGKGCTECPCADCDDNFTYTLCCTYPRAPSDHVICMPGSTCPG